jgi:hypothetical protein
MEAGGGGEANIGRALQREGAQELIYSETGTNVPMSGYGAAERGRTRHSIHRANALLPGG